MTLTAENSASACGRFLLMLGTSVLLLFGTVGCSDLLDVRPQDQVVEEALQDPSRATLLVDGAIAAFECALNSYIQVGGLIGNELAEGSLLAARWPYDRRSTQPSDVLYAESSCTGSNGMGVYTPLSQARFQADYALEHLHGWTDEEVPNRQELIATAAAYSGYSHLLLGEGFCSVAIDESPELFPGDVFELAAEKFVTSAEAAQAVGADDLLDLARVGQARAQRNLGNLSAAADEAALVTEGFSHEATASAAATRRENRIFDVNNRINWISVGEQYRDLTYEGVDDPRVPVVDAETFAFDNQTPLFLQQKYTSISSPIRFASWEEAQLIIAEAALDSDPQVAAGIIDALHQQAGLPEFESTDADEIRDHLIQERQRELFLEGHHLYDLQRFDIPLHPAPGTAYPKGGTYGDQICLPLPNIERFNNPNIPDN